ncbi:MAG: hypothetical protein WC438_04695 [Candidatus Pacearchaeota archaeon]
MKNLFYILLLLMGFSIGYYLSRICKDEIKKWRKELFSISVISLLFAIVLSFTQFEFKFPIILTCFFMIITFLTITWKSYY